MRRYSGQRHFELPCRHDLSLLALNMACDHSGLKVLSLLNRCLITLPLKDSVSHEGTRFYSGIEPCHKPLLIT